MPGEWPLGFVGPVLCALALWGGASGAALGQEPVTQPPAATEAAESEIRTAIAVAVRARVGEEAAVHVTALRVIFAPGTGQGALCAAPEPGSRLGRPMRFTLVRVAQPGCPVTGTRRHRGVRAGEATATVRVVARHARAAQAIARGQALREGDMILVVDDVGEGPLRRLPQELLGARARRAIEAGAILTPTMVAPVPLVRSGDEVRTRVRVGAMEAVGLTVAQQAGQLGDVIRVINRTSHRALRGRIVGPQEIEVIHAP